MVWSESWQGSYAWQGTPPGGWWEIKTSLNANPHSEEMKTLEENRTDFFRLVSFKSSSVSKNDGNFLLFKHYSPASVDLRKQQGLEIRQQAGGKVKSISDESGFMTGCRFNKLVKLQCWLTSVLCASTNEIWTQIPDDPIQALWLHHKPCLQPLAQADYQITGCVASPRGFML